jgi:hypothetical protein
MNLPEDYLSKNLEAAAEIWIMDCLIHCCELIADERPDLFDWFMGGSDEDLGKAKNRL